MSTLRLIDFCMLRFWAGTIEGKQHSSFFLRPKPQRAQVTPGACTVWNQFDRATQEARIARDAVGEALGHGHEAFDETINAISRAAEGVFRDRLEALLTRAHSYFDRANDYIESRQRRSAQHTAERPVALFLAGIGVVALLALLFMPGGSKENED